MERNVNFQLTVVPANTDAEGLFCQIKSDRVPCQGEMFELRLDELTVKGAVYKVLSILNAKAITDSDSALELSTTIVYVVVSISDYRKLEINLPSPWGNYDYL